MRQIWRSTRRCTFFAFAKFSVISFLTLKKLGILKLKVDPNTLPMSRICHNHSFLLTLALKTRACVVALVEAPKTNPFWDFAPDLKYSVTPFTSKLNHIQINRTSNQRNLRQDWWYMCSLQYVPYRPTDVSIITFSQNRRAHASGKLIQSWWPQSINSMEDKGPLWQSFRNTQCD